MGLLRTRICTTLFLQGLFPLVNGALGCNSHLEVADPHPMNLPTGLCVPAHGDKRKWGAMPLGCPPSSRSRAGALRALHRYFSS